ncbi:glycoside hydrolase family 105 protein [Bacteroidota bacterium]
MRTFCKILSLLLILNISWTCTSVNKSGEKNDYVISADLPYSQRMANTVLHKYPGVTEIEERTEPKWTYTMGLLSSALYQVAEKTGDTSYIEYIKKYLDSCIDDEGIILGYKMEDYNIDKINSGKILIDMYMRTGDPRYETAIHTLKKQLDSHPRTESGSFWHKKRYPWQVWLDGLYMGQPFYANYTITFIEPENVEERKSNFEDIHRQFMLIEEKTRDPESGLLYHAWDEKKQQSWADPETGLSANFWGRAMGWYAMALVDVLDYFPENMEEREEIEQVIGRLAEAMVRFQDEESGLWYQVVDKADKEGNYLECTVSSMFTYSLLKAVKKGYISDDYLKYARKSYNGIIDNLLKIEDDGSVILTNVCAVAGLSDERNGSYEYYVNEKRRDNDPKAVGPFIMASLLYEDFTDLGR